MKCMAEKVILSTDFEGWNFLRQLARLTIKTTGASRFLEDRDRETEVLIVIPPYFM